MRTLIVSSYHAQYTPKLKPVRDLVMRYSETETASDIDVGPAYDLEGFQAVVLTGSPNLISKNEYVPKYLQFLRGLKLPCLGICYGHQMLALACGARILNRGAMLEGFFDVRIIEPGVLFRGLPEVINVMESHQEHVALEDLDKAGLDLMANSEICEVEAMHHVERPLFGVQFHIERSGAIGDQVMANFIAYAQEYARKGRGLD